MALPTHAYKGNQTRAGLAIWSIGSIGVMAWEPVYQTLNLNLDSGDWQDGKLRVSGSRPGDQSWYNHRLVLRQWVYKRQSFHFIIACI